LALSGIQQLAGFSLDHFVFVALTWDREPFFTLEPEYLPILLDQNGGDLFRSLSGQVGWLGYQHLRGVTGLIDSILPAVLTMVGSLEPLELDVTTATWPRLVSQPVGQMKPELQGLMQTLEQLGVSVFERDDVIFHTGSISIKSPSRVEAKIVPPRTQTRGIRAARGPARMAYSRMVGP